MNLFQRNALVAVVLLLFAATATAQALKLELRPVVMRARSDAPAEYEARLKWEGTNLLEGQLSIRFSDGLETLGEWHSPEMALTSGDQGQRLMLPAGFLCSDDGQVTARAVFESKGRDIDLGSFTLLTGTRGTRTGVIAVASALGTPRNGDQLATLRLERFDPLTDPGQRVISTMTATIAPGHFPSNAAGYCCYDIVFLAGENFAEIGERQLDALRAWVMAGGSVCVVASTPIDAEHVRFLNALASADRPGGGVEPGDDARFIPMPGGGVAAAREEVGEMHLIYAGLGRAAVVLGEASRAGTPDERSWRRVAAHLWRATAAQQGDFINVGKWSRQRQVASENTRRILGLNNEGELPQYLWLHNSREVPYGDQLTNRLMPRTVRLVPFELTVALLVGFVVLIGPADYFVLGALRRRKLTWVVFPAVTIAFTCIVILLSRGYLGAKDYRNAMTFIDIAPGGQVVRQNRLELVFTSRPRTLETRVTNGLFAPVSAGQLDNHGRAYAVPSQPNARARHSVAEAGGGGVIEGRVPGNFVARQAVEQWSPQINRVMTFDPPAVDPAKPIPVPDELWRNIDRYIERQGGSITVPNGFQGAVYVNQGTKLDFAAGASDVLSETYNRYDMHRPYYYGHGNASRESFIQHASIREQIGFFSVLSQISPAGDGSLEDMSMLDPTDTNTRLVVVVVPQGDDLLVYRRLYRNGGR